MRRVFYEGRQRPDGQFYWFEDNRTGCEKQTVYFERIRQLESELITKEQKHLVGALERLKQLKYPRRKPVVLNQNWKQLPKYQPKFNGEKFKNNEKTTLSLSAKQMEICVYSKSDRANIRSEIESPHARICPSRNIRKTPSNEQHMRYHSEALLSDGSTNTNSRKAPIPDVFLPSLPCIPNVGYKANIEIENKLRILELANGEFQQCRRSRSRRSKKRTANETRSNHDSANGIVEQYALNRDNTPAPEVFHETLSEKEFNKSSYEESAREQEIGKCEIQTKNDECESTNAEQPPPTRRNSQKSTSESKDT